MRIGIERMTGYVKSIEPSSFCF